MPGLYAEGTPVTPAKSQTEIQRTVERYGASGFMMGWQGGEAVIGFVLNGRAVKLRLTLPTDPDEFARTPQNKPRSKAARETAMNAEIRRRWRSLAFVVKAKLETVSTGITSFEEEFAMHLVMPDGQTVGDHVLPTIIQAIEDRRMPDRLLAIEGGK